MTYVIVFALILLSGLFSGLTLGLMSLSAPELSRKLSLGDTAAAKIYAVRKNGNLLLTTLLIGNVAVNAALAVFLGSITSGVAAGFIATALIVVFGEIIPMALFSRYAMSLGVRVIWLVRVFIFVFYPICKPISMILDKVLGEELAAVHSKQELIRIIEEHKLSSDSEVDEAEERFVRGALSFSEKKVEDVMTPRSVVFAVDASREIDNSLLKELLEHNFSRIPVYEGNIDTIIGILYLRHLIDPVHHGKKVKDVLHEQVYVVHEEDKLDNVFDMFIRSKNHLFIVRNQFDEFVGIITLEDILEEIVRTEIIDEGDKYSDLREVARNASRA